jgi:lysophospholipase L1-like esterase
LLAAAGVLMVTLLTAACHGTPTMAAAAGVKSSAAYTAPSGPIVALGDSYTAGALLPLDSHAKPPGCLRSTKAYPVLVAHALGVPLIDAACASAGVKEMTGSQRTYLGTNPAQLTALARDDRMVLLTLGGDDTGFLNVLKECVKLSFTRPWGSPCEAHYAPGGNDQLAAAATAEAPKMARVLAAIGARAPRARIVVVGYPD